MTNNKVLFVDDEPNILSGLRRMFRPFRKKFDFFFVESGQAALDLMAEQNIDIVVSDMRMPGMDGATLLGTIQKDFPQVVRIMLTGQADEESILRTVGVVHQFIAKPSDPETLKMILERASALQDIMKNTELKTLVASIGTLPSLPELYARLQKKMREPDCSLHDIGAIIEQDLAMSAKVLQLVNSSFFGFFTNIDSPARAVSLLGLDTVKSLVLNVGVFNELKTKGNAAFSGKMLWQHSVQVGAYAKRIVMAETNDKDYADQAFVAGFMHDIGKLLLLSCLRERYLEAVELASVEQVPMCHAEYEIFTATHGDVGGYLLGLWGLPSQIVEAVAFHHRLAHYPEPSLSLALIVHAADVISYTLWPGQPGAAPNLNEPYLQEAGVAHRFAAWLDICRQLEA